MEPATTSPAESITLGGRDYPIRPLTIGQLRRILPRFVRVGQLTAVAENGAAYFPSAEAAEEAYEISVHIIAAVLKRDHGLDPDAVDSIEATQVEIDAAIGAIARLSGLKPASAPGAAAGDPPPGS